MKETYFVMGTFFVVFKCVSQRKCPGQQVWGCIANLPLKTSARLNERIDLCNFGSIFASLKGSVHHPTNPPCWTFAKSDFTPL